MRILISGLAVTGENSLLRKLWNPEAFPGKNLYYGKWRTLKKMLVKE